MIDEPNNNLAKLEALLFIQGEPLSVKKIAGVLDLTEAEVNNLISELDKRLAADDRGLSLVVDEEKIQLATKSAHSQLLEKFIKEELNENLTSASLETLSIVLYFGPISRSRIDYLRGVNSSFILRSLLLRGLIERSFDPKRPNVFLYKPSFDLIRHLGLNKKEDAPEYGKFQELLKSFESGDNINQPINSEQ